MPRIQNHPRRLISRIAVWTTVMALLLMAIPLLAPTPAAAANINVSVTKINCAEGTDWLNSDASALFNSGCSVPVSGVGFTIIPDAGEQGEASTDGNGVVQWVGLPVGTGAVYEVSGGLDYSRVFCSLYTTGGTPPDGSYTEYNADGNAIGYALLENESLDCFWFNIPEFTEDGGEDSIINISKYRCPDDYDWQSASLDDLFANCGNAIEGIEFFLYPSDAGEYPMATDNNGQVQWQGVPSGNAVVVESVPDGEVPGRVYCAISIADSDFSEPAEVPLVDGNTINLLLENNTYLDCFWFNVYAEEQGTLELYKFECPADYDWTTAGFVSLTEQCSDPMGDVTYNIGGPAAEFEGQLNNSGFGAWTLPVGDYFIGEIIPSGYGNPRVYCTTAETPDDESDWSDMSVDEGGIGVTVELGQRVACYWFNQEAGPAPPIAPSGPATLTINKYTCEAGYDLFADDSAPRTDCDLDTQDIEFTLEDEDDNSASASTGEGGAPATIQFDDLEGGAYLLQEALPDDVAWAFILSCSSDQRTFDDNLLAPAGVVDPEGRIAINIQASENVECDWFNVLGEAESSVTITKYWCPGEVVNTANCELYDGGIAFTLESLDGGEDISLETGDDGTATAPAEGAYNLVEDDFDWCTAESDFVNDEGELVVEAGEEAFVDVYNCGPQPGA